MNWWEMPLYVESKRRLGIPTDEEIELEVRAERRDHLVSKRRLVIGSEITAWIAAVTLAVGSTTSWWLTGVAILWTVIAIKKTRERRAIAVELKELTFLPQARLRSPDDTPMG